MNECKCGSNVGHFVFFLTVFLKNPCERYRICTCDFFLVREERLNTREYQRVSIYRVNELNLFEKDIRSYQIVSTVLDNLWAWCGLSSLIYLYEQKEVYR